MVVKTLELLKHADSEEAKDVKITRDRNTDEKNEKKKLIEERVNKNESEIIKEEYR